MFRLLSIKHKIQSHRFKQICSALSHELTSFFFAFQQFKEKFLSLSSFLSFQYAKTIIFALKIWRTGSQISQIRSLRFRDRILRFLLKFHVRRASGISWLASGFNRHLRRRRLGGRCSKNRVMSTRVSGFAERESLGVPVPTST